MKCQTMTLTNLYIFESILTFENLIDILKSCNKD